jgi:integrase/recombinase XerC
MEQLKEFINHIRIEKRYSEHTVRAYADDLTQFFHHLQKDTPKKKLLNAQQSDVRHWMIEMVNSGNSPRTLRRKIASLKTFYNYALRTGSLNLNPADGVILPKLKKNLPDFIKESSIEQLFDNNLFPSGFTGVRDKLVLELFYATGMRLSEMVRLTRKDVDLYKDEIRILGKRNKERLVPLTHTAVNLLKEYLRIADNEFGARDTDALILSNKGQICYPKMIQRIVSRYLGESTTLEKKSPHILRHTFATHMLNNGADLNAVKELLGHANLAATEIYTHNTYEKLKSIYKQAHPRA